MVRTYKDTNDKKIIEEKLIQNIEFLMGKNLSAMRDVIIEEINNSIEEIVTREHNDNLSLETTTYLENGQTSLNLVTTKSNIYKNVINRSYTHGLYHTIITYLNNKYGFNYRRENIFFGVKSSITNYNGMLHIVDIDENHYTAGNMFLELFIDFISFLTENQHRYGFNINDYILGNRKIKDDASTDYNPLFSIIRLMLVAFNNDPEFDYQSQLPHGIIYSTCILANHETIQRNPLLDGILINPISILDNWDLIMGEAGYIDFAYYADLFFNNYLNSFNINEEELIEIIKSITDFAYNKYQWMLNNKRINNEEYKKLMHYYNKVYKQVKREFFGLGVKSSRIFNRFITEKHVRVYSYELKNLQK